MSESVQAQPVAQPAAFDREGAAVYVGLNSVSTFERLVRDGIAPQPRKLGARRVVWLRVELDAMLAAAPVSDLLPPPNTGAAKPRQRRQPASNEPSMQPGFPVDLKAA